MFRYGAHPRASDVALSDITAIADSQMEEELEEWEQYLQTQHENDDGAYKVSPRPFLVEGERRGRTPIAEATETEPDPVPRTLFDDDAEYTDSFGFSHRKSRPGSVVAQVEEQLDEFDGFVEDDLMEHSTGNQAEENESWGFNAPRQSQPPPVRPSREGKPAVGTTRRVVIPRGPSGKTGVKLVEEADGLVYITKTTNNSTAAVVLGHTGELPQPLRVVQVFGQPCAGRASVIALMSSQPDRQEVVLVVAEKSSSTAAARSTSQAVSQKGAVNHNWSIGAVHSVTLTRGEARLGLGLDEVNGVVYAARTKTNSPAEKTFGSTNHLGKLRIVRVYGKDVTSQSQCIRLLQSNPDQTDIHLEIVAEPNGSATDPLPPIPEPNGSATDPLPPTPPSRSTNSPAWRSQGTREEVEKLLQGRGGEGTFVVRPSSRTSSGHVLSVLKSDGLTVKHYPIYAVVLRGQKVITLSPRLVDPNLGSATIEDIVRRYMVDPLDTDGLTLARISL